MSETAHIRGAYLAETRRKRIYGGVLLVLFVAMMAAGFRLADDANAGGFFEGLPKLFDFPQEILKEAAAKLPDMPGLLVHFLPSLLETVNIAVVSTLIGLAGGTLMSVLATRGMAPWPRAIPAFRRIMDLCRAMPEIVTALILIYILGGGPVPAMIAIAFHTVGALGKLYSEVNENADLKPVEGLASTGAGWAQRIWLGIVPQVAPNYLSYALLRVEINIRASAILGFVGAGGIGYDLRNTISWGQGKYDEAAAIFVLLFLTIVAVDQLSSILRHQLTKGVAAWG